MPKNVPIPELDKKLYRRVNQVLNDWNNVDYKPQAVQRAENLLEKFYMKHDKNYKQVDRFNLRGGYTKREQNELFKIAQKIVKDDNVYLEDLKKKFRSAQGKHDIQTFDEYVDFINKKEIFAGEALVASSLSYYEFEELKRKADKAGVSEADLFKMIKRKYKKSGMIHSDLYDFIYKELDKLQKKDNKRGNAVTRRKRRGNALINRGNRRK